MGLSMSSFFGGAPSTRSQDIANVKLAGDIISDSKAAYGTNREDIASQFASNVSSARSKMAGSGVSFEGPAWEGIYGGLVRDRDDALDLITAEEEALEEGTSYELVEEDFERMLEVPAIQESWPGDRGEAPVTYSITGVSSLTGESYLTEEQQAMIAPYQDVGEGSKEAYMDYAAAMAPTFAEYDLYRFGTDEEKAAFSDSMTSRIEASTLEYERLMLQSSETAWSVSAMGQLFGDPRSDREIQLDAEKLNPLTPVEDEGSSAKYHK